MDRRNFITTGAAATVAAGLTAVSTPASAQDDLIGPKFKLKYAPSPGTFSALAPSKDYLEQIKFISEIGFRAVFDNGFPGRGALQEKAADLMRELKLDFGPYVLYANFGVESFVHGPRNGDTKAALDKACATAIDIYKRTGAKYALMVPGAFNKQFDWDYQTANVIDSLKYVAEKMEPHGIIIVLEPLSPYNHPGLFLSKMSQAFQICQAVGSPSIKIVDDFFHQQSAEGHLIYHMKRSYSEIAAIHLGDNPGRKEPGTGEINYRNIFKAVQKQGYQGVLCMEHGRSIKGKEGELALIKAYRDADNF